MAEIIEGMPDRIDQQQLARDLVEQARAQGVELVGPGGLLTGALRSFSEPEAGGGVVGPGLLDAYLGAEGGQGAVTGLVGDGAVGRSA